MVKRLLRNSAYFLNLPQGDILSAGFIIMVLSLLSGVLGLVRSRLLTGQFTSDLNGIYFAAFVIPDNIFQILILSSLGAAFIPVFTKYERDHTQWELAQSALSTALVLLIPLIAFCVIFTQPLVSLLVPGIQKYNPTHIALLVNLTRIILLTQPLFFIFSYLCTGILQSYHRFLIPASASLFYNVGIVIGIVVLGPTLGMYGVACGVILGALFHFLIQFPFAYGQGLQLGWKRPFSHPGIKEIGILMFPRAISVATERIELTTDTILASLISISSIAYLSFATQIATFPVSLVASAIAQAALPFFSRALANDNIEEFKRHLRLSLMHIIFLLAPASVLLIVFHTPIVRLTLGSSLFTWTETVITSQTFAVMCIGLVAQGLSNILARAFYALFDTKTPLIITLIAMVITILLSILFVPMLHLDVRFLALSTTIGMYINAIALFILLNKRIGGLLTKQFLKTMAKIITSCTLLAVFSYSIFKIFENYFNTTYTIQLILFMATVGIISLLFYLALSFFFNLEEFHELYALFKKAGSVRKRFVKEMTNNE